MKYVPFLILLLGNATLFYAQEIGQVEAVVSGDKIRVTCMLETANPVDLSLLYSDDGGVTFKNCQTVTGDLLEQASGQKQLVWDCAKDGIVMGRFVFKINTAPSPAIDGLQTFRGEEAVKASEKPKSDTSPPAGNGKAGGVILMPGIAFGKITSYSLMGGYTQNWGFYGKVKYNFAPKGEFELEDDDDDDDKFDADDYSYNGRFSVTGGVVKRINNYIFAYGGAGYSADWIKDKVEIFDESEKEKLSREGPEIELGVLFKIRKFSIGGGVGYLTKQSVFEGNISLGVIF